MPLTPRESRTSGGWHPPAILYAPKAGSSEPKSGGVDLFAEDNPFMQPSLTRDSSTGEWIKSLPGEKTAGAAEQEATTATPGVTPGTAGSALTTTGQHGTSQHGSSKGAAKPAGSRERQAARGGGHHHQDVVPWAVQEDVVSLPVATAVPSDSGQFMGAKWLSPRHNPQKAHGNLTGSYSLPPDDPNIHPSVARGRTSLQSRANDLTNESPPPTRLLAPPSSPMNNAVETGLNGLSASAAARANLVNLSTSPEPASSPDHAGGDDERASPSTLPTWCVQHPGVGVAASIPTPVIGSSTQPSNALGEAYGGGALGGGAHGGGAGAMRSARGNPSASCQIQPLPHVITPSRPPPRPPPPPPQLATRRIGLSYVAKGPTGGAFYWGRPKLPPTLRPPPEQLGVWHPKAEPLRKLTPRSPRELLLLGGQHGGADLGSEKKMDQQASRGWAARQVALGGMSNWSR